MKNERPTPGPKHHRNQSRGTRVKSAQELADEEFQRAIQLSLEESRRLGSGRGAGYVPASALSGASEPPVIDQKQRPTQPQQDEGDDPELRAAIEASLREYQAPKPSAPDAEENQVDPGLDLHPLETDAIMTFSQTVEEAHSRGTRDLVRYPGVGELYDRANKLRPKLAISLDDTGKKEQILTDMHDKLSEAVKLYDRILTEQVNPARRYNQYYGAQQQRQSTMASAYPALASSVPGSSQQPPQMVPSQWSQQPSAVPPVQDYGQAYQQHQPEQSPYPPQQQRQYSYSQYQTPSAPPPPPSTVPSAPHPPQQQQYQQPQQPMSPPPVSANVYPDQKFAHPQQYQHAQQAPMAASTASLPGTAISPPPQQVQQTYNLASIPSAPVTYAASPTPASPPPQQIASSFSPMPPPPTTYAPQPVVAAFPPPPSSSPVRSIVPPPSTIQQTAPTVPDPTPVPSAQYAPTSINPSYVASVHQTQPQNLPAFPLAPTTAPHNSSSAFMYSSPPAAAAGIEQSQPKEAMLISFD
ncbi:Vacuolar protein-sorting-associated protein 27 [Tulasnella sp. 419]|nr:Vacuolar protein-sorting-associated protein 27 [Tulasnella sp. 419]